MSMDWGRALGRPSHCEKFAIAAVLVIGLSAVFCYPWARALLSAAGGSRWIPTAP